VARIAQQRIETQEKAGKSGTAAQAAGAPSLGDFAVSDPYASTGVYEALLAISQQTIAAPASATAARQAYAEVAGI
jgi:hypothetical protein